MRAKEFAHDYRYFPDPDLLPLDLDRSYVERIAADLPELPDAKKNRFMASYGLSAYDSGVLVNEKEIALYFEEAADGRDPKQVANWLTTNLFGALNAAGKDITESPISAAHLGGLVDLLADGTVSSRIAKDVFEEMFCTSKDPVTIVHEKGLCHGPGVGEPGGLDEQVRQVALLLHQPPQRAGEVGGVHHVAPTHGVGTVPHTLSPPTPSPQTRRSPNMSHADLLVRCV